MTSARGAKIEDTSGARFQASREGVLAFHNAGFGLSAHWGLYSLSTSGNEWVYYNDQIPFTTYRKRMEQFAPVRFCAEEWADLMLEAEQEFLLITSKHHDGFCLWDSQLTDFNICNTAFRRDVLAELAAALAERDLALHFYYSLVDWTHPDYRRDWAGYINYYQGQIKELCTRFGRVGGIVFDGYWPTAEWIAGDKRAEEYFAARGPWDLAGTYDLIHTLQPDAVVTNNTHIPPLRGEDYQIWELDLPGENSAGFNCTEIGDKQTACWWNLNAGWSYQPWNHRVKSAEEILATHDAAQTRDAVFVLNVGPRSFGDIHPDEQAVLRQVGQTIRKRKS
jgi:alpha-L-fucosidase